METRNTGFFYVNAEELKMKVFMTCKVPLSTPYFGRFGKLGVVKKKIAKGVIHYKLLTMLNTERYMQYPNYPLHSGLCSILSYLECT